MTLIEVINPKQMETTISNAVVSIEEHETSEISLDGQFRARISLQGCRYKEEKDT